MSTEKVIRFGRNLQVLRNQKGWSQQKLAEKIHVTRQAISIWERGEGKPDIYYFGDICQLFEIDADTMLYKNILEDTTRRTSQKNVADESALIDGFSDFIGSISKKGFYVITEEDLLNFFGNIRYGLVRIMVIALALDKHGYKITEVFDNGFAVVFLSDQQAREFKKTLYDIVDAFIHHNDKFIEEKTEALSLNIDHVRVECIDTVMAELYGKSIYQFAYYWMDDMENPRGYANTEDECKRQAEEQGCKNYVIMKMA